MKFDPNPLFYVMAQYVKKQWAQGKRAIICNEGGSRGGKTFDAFDLITWICDQYRNENLDTYILRDTLANNRDYTLKDWKRLQRINGIELDGKDTPKPEYRLFGNNIFFRGLESEEDMEGYPSDILFFNETLELSKTQVDGLIMRCRKLIIFDWNPKLTKHWVFDYESRKDVLFTHTTYKNNKHLEQTVIDQIESYNPDIEQNIINKTADRFRWLVYGLGVRTDQEGNVFNDSQLNKFNLSDIDISRAVIIGYGDIADQGDDYFSFPIGAMIDHKVYIIDWIFTPKTIEFWMPLTIELITRYNIDKIIMESNNQGLMATKFLKDKIGLPLANKISAVPNSHNKHSRIVTQAQTRIIPDFYFLANPRGMYADAYDMLLNYKYDESYKKDDAPDSLAGLAKQSLFYLSKK